jgi:hypothetical protein
VVRATVRVENEISRRSSEAILDVVDGLIRAKHLPLRAPSHEGISE